MISLSAPARDAAGAFGDNKIIHHLVYIVGFQLPLVSLTFPLRNLCGRGVHPPNADRADPPLPGKA